MKAMLEILLAVLPGDDEIMRRKTIVPVDYGYKLFLSYENHANPASLIHNMEYKNSFRLFLSKYGLCAYIFQGNIILKPDDIDLDNVFIAQFESNQQVSRTNVDRLNLSENLPRIIKSMDSEWDRKLLKVVIGAQHSRKELDNT